MLRHDKKKSIREDNNDYPRQLCSAVITTVRCSYCERHRQLFDSLREQSELPQRYEFSDDESLVNSLESSTSSNSSSRRTTPSCLKDKRLNFTDKEQLENARRTYVNEASNNRRSLKGYESTFTETIQSSASAFASPSVTYPRVVKPRDILKRPATRKMMIYPPEGQRGEPVTLSKKYSNIQCRVNGNEDTGFRYKVYYLQTFESDKWLPNDKTNSPFRHHDESDNSTDYGN